MQYSETEVHLVGKSNSDTFKHIMDNLAICMGKSIFTESRENLSTKKTATKVWDCAGIELATPGSAVRLPSVARHVTDCATWPGRNNSLK